MHSSFHRNKRNHILLQKLSDDDNSSLWKSFISKAFASSNADTDSLIHKYLTIKAKAVYHKLTELNFAFVIDTHTLIALYLLLCEIKLLTKQEQDHYSQLKLHELQKRKEKIVKHIETIKKESKVGCRGEWKPRAPAQTSSVGGFRRR